MVNLRGPHIHVELMADYFSVEARRDMASPITLKEFWPTDRSDLRRCHVEANEWAGKVAKLLAVDMQEFPE